MIHHVVEESYNSDIREIIIINNSEKKSIENYFDKNYSTFASKNSTLDMLIENCNFLYIQQREMLGLGHAISTTEECLNKETFAVILPDDLCYSETPVLKQLIEVHEKYPEKCIVAIEEVSVEDIEKYGVIQGEKISNMDNLYQVSSIKEKPKPTEIDSRCAVIGRYILTAEIFSAIRESSKDSSGEIQITSALNILAKKGKVLAYKFQGKRLDCGSHHGLFDANAFFYSNHRKNL